MGSREGKKDPGPHLLSVLFSGGNLENPFFLLRRQMFIFSAASVILFQILKAFLPPPLPPNNHFICSGDTCETSLKKMCIKHKILILCAGGILGAVWCSGPGVHQSASLGTSREDAVLSFSNLAACTRGQAGRLPSLPGPLTHSQTFIY